MGMEQHLRMEAQSKPSPCASSPYFITEASYIWHFRSLGGTQTLTATTPGLSWPQRVRQGSPSLWAAQGFPTAAATQPSKSSTKPLQAGQGHLHIASPLWRCLERAARKPLHWGQVLPFG